MHRQEQRERDDIVKGRYLYRASFGRAAAFAFIVFFLVLLFKMGGNFPI